MQQIKFGKWLLETDIEKTLEFYNKDLDVCSCLYCKNFVEAANQLTPNVFHVFAKLGINPSKPAHLSYLHSDEADITSYLGNYHLIGRMLEGELCRNSNWNKENTIEMDNFTFGFSEELEFVPKGFPSPILELSFDAKIPWVLNEKP